VAVAARLRLIAELSQKLIDEGTGFTRGPAGLDDSGYLVKELDSVLDQALLLW